MRVKERLLKIFRIRKKAEYEGLKDIWERRYEGEASYEELEKIVDEVCNEKIKKCMEKYQGEYKDKKIEKLQKLIIENIELTEENNKLTKDISKQQQQKILLSVGSFIIGAISALMTIRKYLSMA